jgi:hypothetical protein
MYNEKETLSNHINYHCNIFHENLHQTNTLGRYVGSHCERKYFFSCLTVDSLQYSARHARNIN